MLMIILLCIDRELSGFQWFTLARDPQGYIVMQFLVTYQALHTVFDNEAKHKKRNEYQKLMDKKET